MGVVILADAKDVAQGLRDRRDQVHVGQCDAALVRIPPCVETRRSFIDDVEDGPLGVVTFGANDDLFPIDVSGRVLPISNKSNQFHFLDIPHFYR